MIFPLIFAPMKPFFVETRGRPSKYNFDRMQIGKPRVFDGDRRNILRCAKNYSYQRELDWKFITRTIKGKVHLIRVE